MPVWTPSLDVLELIQDAMRKVVSIAVCLTCFAVAVSVKAQTNETASVYKTILSDRPFFRTQSVLTLSGDYVNTPKEDFEMLGVWNLPITLDQMDGLIAGIAFGEAEQQGQWQLAYRRKLATLDTSWGPI